MLLPWASKSRRHSKFTDSQIAFILRQTEEGVAVEEVSGRLGFPSRRIIDGVRNTAG